jgi:hypothetical protein
MDLQSDPSPVSRRGLPIDEANGPIALQPQRVCHDTLPWLISRSLDPESMSRLEITYSDDYLVDSWKRFRRAKFAARAMFALKAVL